MRCRRPNHPDATPPDGRVMEPNQSAVQHGGFVDRPWLAVAGMTKRPRVRGSRPGGATWTREPCPAANEEASL